LAAGDSGMRGIIDHPEGFTDEDFDILVNAINA
jgi:hypothetical protein